MNATAVRVVWIEIRGFRAFGSVAQRLLLDAPLVVVHAGNSQGKSSLAEALEFLISGRSSRREMLGGAKAEYNDSLRNAHLPVGDDDVYVEAKVLAPDGEEHHVRRELTCDFGSGTECESRLFIDGTSVSDLASVGLPMNDPPVRASVLLQHTLRHVLSTEPKQRVGYFKALLSLTDLDDLRGRVSALRGRVDRETRGSGFERIAALAGTPAANVVAEIEALVSSPLTEADTIRSVVDATLLKAGETILGEPTESLDELRAGLGSALEIQRERAFPLNAFGADALASDVPSPPELAPYREALEAADLESARLAPIVTALLAAEGVSNADHAVDCPICGTTDALTPARVAMLRDQLRQTSAVESAASVGLDAIRRARRSIASFLQAIASATPAAGTWMQAEVSVAAEQFRRLQLDDTLRLTAQQTAARVVVTADELAAVLRLLDDALDETERLVTIRSNERADLDALYHAASEALQTFRSAQADNARAVEALRLAVAPVVQAQTSGSGLAELLAITGEASQLAADVVQESGRLRAAKRLAAAELALRDAAGRVLDERFAHMSTAISEWWLSIRPEELVGFGGVKRRAGGALFVNLVAALRVDHGRAPVERDALGVYSDSQLNALGLSIFLARAELLQSPLIVLDDPIPGSDADHRLTFVQNTLSRLLDAGRQVLITTFDSKLADWTQSNHDYRGIISYELNLIDVAAGTEVTQTSDVFSRLLLEAEDNLNAPTARGRRAACGSYRAAAERLAKQIVATGRTEDGQPSSVADIDAEADTLRDLVSLVAGYALDNAEKGQWRTFAKVLNPGNHDDDVPSTTELKQVRGNLRKIAKAHRAYWPNSLIT